jgi:hypothetical protein
MNVAHKNKYTPDTMVNNWNEERFDANYTKLLKPITNVINIFLFFFK